MSRNLLSASLGAFLLCCFLVGCLNQEKYSYIRIKAEYEGRRAVQKGTGIGSTPADERTPSRPLSLAAAISIALENNPDIDMAIARIHQSEAMVDASTASFWPAFSVYGEYLQGDAPSAYLFKTIDQRKLPPDVNFNDPGWFENYEVGLQGRINLFNGGRDLLRKRMAETGLGIHSLDRESVENALIASVSRGFYNALAAQAYITIARESVSMVKTELEIMLVRYKAGGVLKSDVLSLEVRLAQAREDLVKAENHFSFSIASLANLLGLDAETSLSLKAEESLPPALPEDFQGGLQYALEHRPEIKKIRLQISQAAMELDLGRSQYLPRLDAQAKYYMDDPDLDFETERDNWTAGILLNWDLFTGLSTRAQISKARALLNERIAADRKTVKAVQLDLKAAYLNLTEARERLSVSKTSVAQAEESLRLVRTQYEGGSATVTRYLEAELALNTARMRATRAFYDREKAVADLGRALGYWARSAQGSVIGQ